MKIDIIYEKTKTQIGQKSIIMKPYETQNYYSQIHRKKFGLKNDSCSKFNFDL